MVVILLERHDRIAKGVEKLALQQVTRRKRGDGDRGHEKSAGGWAGDQSSNAVKESKAVLIVEPGGAAMNQQH